MSGRARFLFPAGRCAAVFGLLTLAFLGSRAIAQTAASSIVIRSLGTPGAIEIANEGDSEMAIRGSLIVERKRDGHWIQTPVVFQAVEACDGNDAPHCVHLAAGAHIHPVPWNGYTCSGQCTRSCRSNHYNGPGEFRFVVQSCDRSHRYVSDSFEIGPEPVKP
ncbi:MAG: hypothetical protein WA324_13600 [Bryobacteraceae bacterium]